MHIAISYNQTMNFLFQIYDRFVQYLTKKRMDDNLGDIYFRRMIRRQPKIIYCITTRIPFC